MEYADAVDYVESLGKFGIHLGMERIQGLTALLDHPERKIRTVHVTGTNGKGSVTTFLANMLQQAGLKVGSYTSPHFVRYNERICLNGEEISNEDFAAVTEKTKAALDRFLAQGGEQPTQFEFITAMAFLSMAFIGEEIRNDIADPKKKVMTGYVLESYEEKFVERKLAGGMKSKDDVSEVTVKRVSDGKKIKLRLGQKETVTDISATVSLVRGATLNKSFTKAKGEKISVPELGVSWVVENIEQKVEKGKKQVVVRIKDEATGKSTSVFSATK